MTEILPLAIAITAIFEGAALALVVAVPVLVWLTWTMRRPPAVEVITRVDPPAWTKF